MTIRVGIMGMAVLALCACRQSAEDTTAANRTNVATNQLSPAPPAENASTNVSLPDDRAPLEEPHGRIDPTSAEAAGQVVQHYAALIEQGRWKEAKAYWGDSARAEGFRGELAAYSESHMEIGKPGQSEGAAGSIYISVPVVFYGSTKAGANFRRAAKVTLRRVNDVPGSTAAQRNWHIEQIEWAR